MQHIQRRRGVCAAVCCGGGGFPQLHAAARRHHGQCCRPPRQTCRTPQMGCQQRHPFGRCHDDLLLPSARTGRPGHPAPYFPHLQRYLAEGVRGTAVRHGFRSARKGSHGGLPAHDIAQDGRLARRCRRHRCGLRRGLAGGLRPNIHLRYGTGHGIPDT